MKSIINYLDDLKEKTGSDYKSAQIMEIEKSTISNIRKRELMSDETAIKIAKLLEVDEQEILIAAAIARSQGDVKTAWQKIYQRMGKVAGFLLIIQGVSALPGVWDGIVCILC